MTTRKQRMMGKEHKELSFGTSGLRDTVENMTDMECYINTRGFLVYLKETGEFKKGGKVAIAGDRRPSTYRIKRAVAAAIRDSGGVVDDQGLVPSPALAFYSGSKSIPSIMITGSHIPSDRNGIKFAKKSGEVLKLDEEGILKGVREERGKIYSILSNNSIFDDNGTFKKEAQEEANTLLEKKDFYGGSRQEYTDRYKNVFGNQTFAPGIKIFLYQHSAVGRDMIKEIFEGLGAEVLAPDKSIEIEYADEDGIKRFEKVNLRSNEFVSVDTESVSTKTMAIFRKAMYDNDLDIGISMDGDSDRPLLVYRVYSGGEPTDEVRYVTGDILGLLAVLGLEKMGVRIDSVSVPVSANDAITMVLKEKGVFLTETKIGSPYVIAAMNEYIQEHPEWNVFSWESNGGFLTGSDLNIKGKVLKALPTRDAVLPLISVIMMSVREKMPISEIFKSLPARFTYADRKKEFPVEKSKRIISSISPVIEKKVQQVNFAVEGGAVVFYANGSKKEIGANSEFHGIRIKLENVFTKKHGFNKVDSINYIDGVKIRFSNSEISHLRPSGNAPEFRNYAIANTPERAKEIVEIGIKEIIPELGKNCHCERTK